MLCYIFIFFLHIIKGDYTYLLASFDFHYYVLRQEMVLSISSPMLSHNLHLIVCCCCIDSISSRFLFYYIVILIWGTLHRFFSFCYPFAFWIYKFALYLVYFLFWNVHFLKCSSKNNNKFQLESFYCLHFKENKGETVL